MVFRLRCRTHDTKVVGSRPTLLASEENTPHNWVPGPELEAPAVTALCDMPSSIAIRGTLNHHFTSATKGYENDLSLLV